jgi:hypothetical protein
MLRLAALKIEEICGPEIYREKKTTEWGEGGEGGDVTVGRVNAEVRKSGEIYIFSKGEQNPRL